MQNQEKIIVASFAELIASYSHEIKNILAIIQESSGLLQDLINLKLGEEFPYKDKFSRSSSVIEQQVERGQILSSQLNLLAHTPDHNLSAIDVGSYLEMVVLLSQKIARRHSISVKADIQDGLEIKTSPVKFICLVFRCLKRLFQAIPPQSVIVIQAYRQKRDCVIELAVKVQESEGVDQKNISKGESPELLSEIDQLAQSIQIEVKEHETLDWIRLTSPGDIS